MKSGDRKELLAVALCALLITGCSKPDNDTVNSNTEQNTEQTTEQETEQTTETEFISRDDASDRFIDAEYDSFGDILQVSEAENGGLALDMNEGEYTDLSKALETYTAESAEYITGLKGNENTDAYCSEDIYRADTYALSFLAKYYTMDSKESSKLQLFDTYNFENEDSISSAQLSVNDNKSVANMYDTYYTKESRSYFVHTASEGNYIIVYTRGSLDLTGTYVSFDLSADVQNLDYEESIYLGKARITDPYKIRIEKPDFVTELASCFGIKKLNEKGIIADDSKEMTYTYDDTYAIAAQDIDGKKVDEQTGEVTDESVMINADEKVQMISSNQHTWCIVKTEDGALVKVTFEGSYGAEINGKNVFNIARN